MSHKSDRLIKKVYNNWQNSLSGDSLHPDEEAFACFIEGKLPQDQAQVFKEHVAGCSLCLESLFILFSSESDSMDVPEYLMQKVKNLVASSKQALSLDIFLKLKEKALEVLNTTGDVLVGQELVPAPVLRSRQIRDFKDEVNIFKDFDNIRVEAKIENKSGREFNLSIIAKEKISQGLIKDLRFTLIKDDVELESYHVDTGKVIFEHILLGAYKVEITSPEERLALIVLDIKA